MSASDSQPQVKISADSAEVTIRKVFTGNGERLEISAPNLGHSVLLDAIELESLTWQTPESLAECLEPRSGN